MRSAAGHSGACRVFAPELDGRRGHQHNGLGTVAKIANALMEVSLRIPNVMRLVHDDEIELGGGSKRQQLGLFGRPVPPPSTSFRVVTARRVVLPWRTCSAIRLPVPFPSGNDAAERRLAPVKLSSKRFISVCHLPLRDKRLGADDKNG